MNIFQKSASPEGHSEEGMVAAQMPVQPKLFLLDSHAACRPYQQVDIFIPASLQMVVCMNMLLHWRSSTVCKVWAVKICKAAPLKYVGLLLCATYGSYPNSQSVSLCTLLHWPRRVADGLVG